MARSISRSIAPTLDDIASLRGPFGSKGNADPVVNRVRAALNASLPSWLNKLSDTDELTASRLHELDNALKIRRALLDLLPDGADKESALAPLDAAATVVADMLAELTDGDTEAAHSTAYGTNGYAESVAV